MEEIPSPPAARRSPVRLLVACSSARDAHALASSIAVGSARAIAAEATDLRWLARKSEASKPDVALVEHVPGSEDRLWTVIDRMARASANTRVMLLCDSYSHHVLADFVRHGVSGCVLRAGSPEHWARAVLAVHRGEPWFRRSILLRALKSQLRSAPAHEALFVADAPLTAREREILGLVARGLKNKEVGQQLEISDKTVKTHLHNIYRKMNHGGRYKLLLAHGPALQASRSAENFAA